MITEDYVSFETAKFLKEKGFDIPTKDFYDTTGENLKDSKTIYGGIPDFGEVNWNADPFVCEGFPKLITFSKPSQSLALKWLREVHRIETHIVLSELNTDNSRKYMFDIYSSDINRDFDSVQKEGFNSYEQAVEAALLYVLKNLI